MKYQKNQEVILLATDGKPPAGKAVVQEVNVTSQTYTVAHYLNNAAEPDIIENLPEGRLVTAADFVKVVLNSK
ncbi:MAG: hypothetical protein V4592_14765 [Bacteroidota bacterium]